MTKCKLVKVGDKEVVFYTPRPDSGYDLRPQTKKMAKLLCDYLTVANLWCGDTNPPEIESVTNGHYIEIIFEEFDYLIANSDLFDITLVEEVF